jgi:hypothetical protein
LLLKLLLFRISKDLKKAKREKFMTDIYKKGSPHLHDKFFKASLAHIDIAQDLLKNPYLIIS